MRRSRGAVGAGSAQSVVNAGANGSITLVKSATTLATGASVCPVHGSTIGSTRTCKGMAVPVMALVGSSSPEAPVTVGAPATSWPFASYVWTPRPPTAAEPSETET